MAGIFDPCKLDCLLAIIVSSPTPSGIPVMSMDAQTIGPPQTANNSKRGRGGGKLLTKKGATDEGTQEKSANSTKALLHSAPVWQRG